MEVKFLCDQMLGTLAKWLRILGFDVCFADRIESDDEIIERAKREGRVILTRDKYLVRRAKRENISAVEIKSTDLDEQIKVVISEYPIDENKILSRCSVCNNILAKIDKEKVKGKVPDRVYNRHDEFWYCENCGRIYWKGTHWDNMKSRIEKVSSNGKTE